MSITLTDEQLAVIEFMAKRPESLLISALAGAAKTTTLVHGAHKLPMVPTISLAFNKKIAVEMAQRMPSHVECQTLNALGHRVWGKTIGTRLSVSSDKMYTLLTAYIDKHFSGRDKADAKENLASLLRGLRTAKSSGYVPAKAANLGRSLTTQEELAEGLAPHIDCNPDSFFFNLIDQVLYESIQQAYAGSIDFDDQIYMSTLFGGVYPKYPIVLVDEAQDLSLLNHASLRLLAKDRVIAVGDPNQSIYGFRGAHQSSMEVLRSTFDMAELSLSTSFRCPKAVVRLAQRRVPNMRFPDWAVEGNVATLEHWTNHDVPDGSVIICRNNAPLFAIAMKFIQQGRGIRLVGSDIGAGLVRLMDKISRPNVPSGEFQTLIKQWQAAELEKGHKSRHAAINDRADCLLIFATFGKDKDEAKAYAQHLFAQSGPVSLMTGHKSKGLEFDNVFFLDPHLIPSKFARKMAEAGDSSQMDQELNLKYVIETRAKQNLTMVYSDEFDITP